MGVIAPFNYGQLMSMFPQFGAIAGTPPSAVFTGSIAADTLTVTAFTSGTLPVGSLLSGANADVQLGTYVSSIVTPGSVFKVNYPQSAPLEAMTATIGQLTLQQAQAFYNEAIIYHRNDGMGPVNDLNQQSYLINLVIAHLATMYLSLNGVAIPGVLVGRISQASEGPFSLSTDLDVPAGSAQWWAQTKPGFDYWAATAPFRTFRWRPGPRRNMNPWFGGPYWPHG